MVQELLEKIDADLGVEKPMAKDVPEDPEQREACEISLQTLLGEEQMTQIGDDETKMEEANSWFQA